MCSREIIYMFLVGQVSWLAKNIYTGIFSDTINVVKVQLCMTVLLIELYLFIAHSPWPYFKVTAVSNSFNWELYLFIWLSSNFVALLSTSSSSQIYHYFWLLHILKGGNWHVSGFDKHFIVSFFMDTVQVRFFKLCMIITFRGVYQFIQGLMTIFLFQDHRCVRMLNCKHFFRFLSNVL